MIIILFPIVLRECPNLGKGFCPVYFIRFHIICNGCITKPSQRYNKFIIKIIKGLNYSFYEINFFKLIN